MVGFHKQEKSVKKATKKDFVVAVGLYRWVVRAVRSTFETFCDFAAALVERKLLFRCGFAAVADRKSRSKRSNRLRLRRRNFSRLSQLQSEF